MTQVTVTDSFDHSAAAVWPVVSDFGGLHKYMRGMEPYPVVGSGIGQDRSLPMAGGEVVERLTWLDNDAMAFSYTIISGPLPFERYVATVKLSADGARTGIEWQGNFEPAGVTEEEASTLANKIYAGAIKGFKKALEG
ncbi:MAG: SRPBCC family protein [Acidimicrobiales bacterium]